MANNNENKILNVPHLRFPEFSGEWKKCKLGDLCNVLMCKRILVSQTNTEDGVPFYKIGTIGSTPDAYISKELFDDYKVKYNYPRKGEVMITCAGTVGKCVVYDGEDAYFQDSNIVWIDNPTQYISNGFLFHLLSKVDWRKLNSTTIIRIYNDDLRNLKMSYPRKEEQQKISHLLSLLDERIATQNKIIEDLKKLKSAISERLFNAIKGDVVVLEDIGDVVKGKQINGEFLSESGKYYVMNGGIEPSGFYNDYNVEANTISISEGGNSCGYVQFNACPFWSGGHCYTIQNTTDNVKTEYLYQFLKSKESEIMKLRIGSGLPNIQKKDLAKFKITIPNISEQKVISAFLSSFERKADVEMNFVNLLLEEKQYLLRQMFI
ncbi:MULTISPECIES: restriction endonuclease subunit S [Bacteroidaceae]|uniref:restriction endonuclease subunit S n=1 Tax=Bacteroidaceae TaxID=815 RepID=UPI001BF0F9B0|nr:Type I restriction modification DNA specificity domain protein [Phocaeicola vulgatus]